MAENPAKQTPSLFVESSVDDRPMKTVSKDTNIPPMLKFFTDSIAEVKHDTLQHDVKSKLTRLVERFV